MSTPFHSRLSTLVSGNVTKTTVTEFFRGASDVYADILLNNARQEYHLFISKKKPEIVAVVKPLIGQVENSKPDTNLVVTAKSITPFYNMVAQSKESEVDKDTRIVLGLGRGKVFIPFAICELTQAK